MSNTSSSKGNPASTRMSNPALKARRARNWAEQQRTKEARRKAQAEREQRNRELRAQGLPTPHEAKKAARKARRDALREAGLLPPVGVTRQQWEAEKKAAA